MTQQNLKLTRERLGVTQEQLAKLLGITASAVSKMEAGINPVKQTTAMAIELLLLKHNED